MNYYEIAIIGLNLQPLTYESEFQLSEFEIVSVVLRGKEQSGCVIKSVSKPNFKTTKISKRLNLNFTTFQATLAKFISHYYTCEIGVALGLFEPFSGYEPQRYSFIKSPNLSPLQQQATQFIKQNQISLIFGDTGSGKSEIYISLIRECLNSGKQALFLMPEISLTPQMQERLEAYFGDSVGIWHSKISTKNKKSLLSNFSSGKINLIAGARSSLFLPFSNLGLIVVDEEHDDSYKSSSDPYYNAKDLAIYIANKFGIKCILGSATPSLNSYAKFPHFRLKGQFYNSQKEYIYDHSPTGLNELILNSIAKELASHKQIIIFLPTRANFKFLTCQKCAQSIQCPYCSISLSLHKKQKALKCHYCGFTCAIPNLCPSCNNDMLESRKIGTSELVLELKSHFPSANIAKFDKDEITTQKKLTTLLKNFNENKIDIIVGTQMLSKGHDYHNVSLAIIMGLDEHLDYIDYQARSKSLALAMQVAGRAGRADHGKVIIQGLKCEFFAQYMDKFDQFIDDEMSLREGLYPPFMRLLRIKIEDKDENRAIIKMEKTLKELENIPNLEIIGSGKCIIEMIASKYRYQILLRSQSHTPLLKASQIARFYGALPDIDPVNFN
ncbi:primosomal protein N' [Campylobacter lanienae]|uniref:primosomal protein N' n=1 Tax=Campylobacter lanienae TaxID=75658 RepID=UPI000BB4451A|nr:primosomal protein N' [Campylobacter lanienae]